MARFEQVAGMGWGGWPVVFLGFGTGVRWLWGFAFGWFGWFGLVCLFRLRKASSKHSEHSLWISCSFGATKTEVKSGRTFLLSPSAQWGFITHLKGVVQGTLENKHQNVHNVQKGLTKTHQMHQQNTKHIPPLNRSPSQNANPQLWGLRQLLEAWRLPKWLMGQKENPNGDHRFWSIFPFTNRVFWVPDIFDPKPNGWKTTALTFLLSPTHSWNPETAYWNTSARPRSWSRWSAFGFVYGGGRSLKFLKSQDMNSGKSWILDDFGDIWRIWGWFFWDFFTPLQTYRLSFLGYPAWNHASTSGRWDPHDSSCILCSFPSSWQLLVWASMMQTFLYLLPSSIPLHS